jgi:threonine dehydrogenase-like Zn-dependent dehydrogenase
LKAKPVHLDDNFRERVDVALDAVGATVTRQACQLATCAGGQIIWIGLHERDSTLDINDMIRREITCSGSFAYTHRDFRDALEALHQRRLRLSEDWTRIESLDKGTTCFEELLHGSSVAKIWLQP